jgi:hypothetical protein
MNWYKKSKSEYRNMIFSQRDQRPNIEDPIANWADIDSSFLSQIGYNKQSHRLGIKTKSGKEYWYDDVPTFVYEDFLAAGSKGEFFNKIIKPNYKRSL